MLFMDFDVLPGPPLPELARTALARAATATVSAATVPGGPAAAGPVPVRSTRDGSPLLLPAAGSPLARWLLASPDPVRVSLPAGPPFSALRLTAGRELPAGEVERGPAGGAAGAGWRAATRELALLIHRSVDLGKAYLI